MAHQHAGGHTPTRQHDLERIAGKSKPVVGLVAFVLGPVGYALLGKWGLAILCLLTVNWFLTGFLVAPLHCRKIIQDARDELDTAYERP